MQKNARILFLLILLLMPVLLTGILTGCRTAHRDPLCYQKYPFSADGTLTLGELHGEVRFTMEAAGRGSLTFLSPASVSGLRLTADGEGVCVTLGDHSYAFGEDSGICPVLTRLVAATMLPAILSEIFRGYQRRQKEPQPDTRIPQTRIREILQYVNRHLYEELTLDDLCRRFYISKTQLGRLFRAATGSTAWDYILVKRLIRARQLILSGVPITEASMRCGFRDYSAFYRAYKKRYTTSPTADRGRTLVGL